MENGEISRVKVSILGQNYSIKGSASPEYIERLSDFVNGKMEEARINCSGYNPTQLAILVALNIADEYFQIRDAKTGIDSAVTEKTRTLISMLDEGLIGDIFSRVQRVS